MARILAIVAARDEGTLPEDLARAALTAAAGTGWEACLVRLGDLNLHYCQGCLRCVFGAGCPRPDDVGWLFETVEACDAFLLAAPAWLLGPPAEVKVLIDRGVARFPVLERQRPRPFGTIVGGTGPAGDAGTRRPSGPELALPVLNELGFLLGGWWAGAVLHDGGKESPSAGQDSLAAAGRLGLTLAGGKRLPPLPGRCPVCGLPGTFPETCPFCLTRPGEEGSEQRFSGSSLARHLADWMLPSRDRFRAHAAEVRAAAGALSAFQPRRIIPG